MSYIKSHDNINLFYKKIIRKNAKETILFLHGGGVTNHSMLNPLMSMFQDYNIIAPDRRGIGFSDYPKNLELDFNDYTKDIETILKKEKIKQVIIIAISLGGFITMNFIKSTKIKIKKLVLVSSSYTLKHKKRFHFIKKILDYLSKRLYNLIPGKPKKNIIDSSTIQDKNFLFHVAISNMKNYNLKAFLAQSILMSKMFDLEIKKQTYQNINFPVLIIFSSNDEFFNLEQQMNMNKWIKKSKLIVLKNHTHDVYKYNTELVVKPIKKFLANN